MKNLIRSVVLALALTLLLGIATTGYAQEDDYCFGLGEEDCALYYELAESAEFPLSSAFELNVSTNIEVDFPDEQDELAFGIFVNGAYTIDADAVETAVDEFNNTPILDVSARTFLNLARNTVGSFDAELSLDYDFPPEAGVPPIGPFNVWLVDGVGYIDFTPFQAFDPSLEGVYGVDLFDFIEVPLSQVVLGDFFAEFEGMSGGGDFDFDPSEIFDENGNIVIETGFDEETLASFESSFDASDMSMEDLGAFVSVERLDDETVDGVDVVVYVTSIDLEAAMQVEAIAAQAYASAVESGLPEDEVSEEEFSAALAEALVGSTITVTEKIDPETGIGMAVVVEANINLDIAPIAALSGDQEEGSMTISVLTEFIRSDVNAVDEIVLPEGATEIPVEALLGGF